MSLNLNRIGSKSHVDLYHLSNHGQDIKRSTTSLNKINPSSPLINGKRFASSTSLYSSLTNLSDCITKKPIKSRPLITKVGRILLLSLCQCLLLSGLVIDLLLSLTIFIPLLPQILTNGQ